MFSQWAINYRRTCSIQYKIDNRNIQTSIHPPNSMAFTSISSSRERKGVDYIWNLVSGTSISIIDAMAFRGVTTVQEYLVQNSISNLSKIYTTSIYLYSLYTTASMKPQKSKGNYHWLPKNLLEGKPAFILLHLILNRARVSIHNDAQFPILFTSTIESTNILAPHGGSSQPIQPVLNPIHIHTLRNLQAFHRNFVFTATGTR
mgnify:CR=1 FL=1